MTTINQFASVVEKDLAEISGALKDINTRLHNIELREASCSPMLGSRLDAIRFRIDAQERAIQSLTAASESQKVINSELRQANKILTWLGGLLSSAVILWILTNVLELL